MSKLKVSELQRATSINLTDLMYVVQSNTSKAVTAQDLLGNINGNVRVTGSITANAIIAPSYSSSQANALTVSNGTIIFNSQTYKLQVYASGGWINLH
jgi:hypothetical protein